MRSYYKHSYSTTERKQNNHKQTQKTAVRHNMTTKASEMTKRCKTKKKHIKQIQNFFKQLQKQDNVTA